ncbi:unnamed protein product [Didymodactylos carnosus]|uniref:Uncharacterized protein n=1 Tax=Didymodactylos carnosus TaxID=1234261 RepID=A0A814J2C0_9BILA|nr:unnamed protein product [Didymodactylos carnosus]CAF1032392.1 unnamed protein product [Didymodactylos carnosus]CAF3607633.1 unnamed protein product [Didymodactylos carnosus]CAF3803156.1 unnamed protein product [Didymodactylos carnosus]
MDATNILAQVEMAKLSAEHTIADVNEHGDLSFSIEFQYELQVKYNQIQTLNKIILKKYELERNKKYDDLYLLRILLSDIFQWITTIDGGMDNSIAAYFFYLMLKPMQTLGRMCPFITDDVMTSIPFITENKGFKEAFKPIDKMFNPPLYVPKNETSQGK